MLYLTYFLNILLLFGIPIAGGVFLVRKYDLEGRWWWNGASIYVISLIITTPLQNYVINPFLNNISVSGTMPSIEVLILGGVLLGFTAGASEELLRYAMFRWWAKDARSLKSGMLLGLGHGGAGSIILGVLVLYNFINMATIRNMDLTTIVSAELVQLLKTQVAAYWSAPWYFTFREAIGQIFNLVIQVCLAVMVLQIFFRRKIIWLMLAIGFHTLVETTRVITLNLSNEYLMNAALGLFAIVSIMIIFSLRNLKAPERIVKGV